MYDLACSLDFWFVLMFLDLFALACGLPVTDPWLVKRVCLSFTVPFSKIWLPFYVWTWESDRTDLCLSKESKQLRSFYNLTQEDSPHTNLAGLWRVSCITRSSYFHPGHSLIHTHTAFLLCFCSTCSPRLFKITHPPSTPCPVTMSILSCLLGWLTPQQSSKPWSTTSSGTSLMSLCCKRHYLKTTWTTFSSFLIPTIRFIAAPSKIQMDPVKRPALTDWPISTTRKDLQHFMGLANFYRWFIHDYSPVAMPLTSITSVKIPFAWTEQAVEVGAVSSQWSPKDNKLHPCYFPSHRLSPAERNYNIDDCLPLAVKLVLVPTYFSLSYCLGYKNKWSSVRGNHFAP